MFHQNDKPIFDDKRRVVSPSQKQNIVQRNDFDFSIERIVPVRDGVINLEQSFFVFTQLHEDAVLIFPVHGHPEQTSGTMNFLMHSLQEKALPGNRGDVVCIHRILPARDGTRLSTWQQREGDICRCIKKPARLAGFGSESVEFYLVGHLSSNQSG
jgi:hypothetical protein